jgi:cyclopropane fatty-acyl-phospholipid synthase-like methyltransferase
LHFFVKQIRNLAWEYYLGITTRGIVNTDHPDAVYYATMDYYAIRKALDYLDLKPTDVFVDIGVGKGRAICLAARHTMRRAEGIDISPQLCAIAASNVARLRGRRTPVIIHNRSAIDADYTETSVVWLFHPFGGRTMDAVLTKLRDDRKGKPLRIAYCSPAEEAVFAKHDWLQLIEKVDNYFPVNFYQSR